MKYFEYIKFVLLTAVLTVFAMLFLQAYQTKARNEAIDGCYQASFYRTESIENGKTITTSEPQKWVYTQCLSDKGIK